MAINSPPPQRGMCFIIGLITAVSGAFISGISILHLLQYALTEKSWAAPIIVMVEYWDSFLDTVFTTLYIQQFIEFIITFIANQFDLDEIPTLYPHWRHIFVPLLLISNSLTLNTFLEGKRKFAIWALSISLLIGLISSVLAGVIPLVADSVWNNTLIAALPISAFFMTVYVVWLPINKSDKFSFKQLLKETTFTTIIIFIIVLSNIKYNFLDNNVQLPLILIIIFIIITGVRRIIAGYKDFKKEGGSFFGNQYTKRGLTILYGFIFVLGTIVCDAGYGL